VDVADPGAPLLVGVYDTPGDAREVVITGDYVLLADGPGGLRVLAIHDPRHPREVATYATPDYARQVVIANGLLYVADRLGGLYIFGLTSP